MGRTLTISTLSMYLPATFVQRLCVRTASGSDRIIFHLSFDIFHLLFDGRKAALLRMPSDSVVDDPVATARGSDTRCAHQFFNSSGRRTTSVRDRTRC